MRKVYLFSLFLGLAALSACSPQQDHGQATTPQICPLLYQPVCGQKSAAHANFANPCEASKAGYKVISQGACQAANAPQGAQSTPLSKPCTREYRPVCGVKGKTNKTFANSCMAEASGYQILKTGACL